MNKRMNLTHAPEEAETLSTVKREHLGGGTPNEEVKAISPSLSASSLRLAITPDYSPAHRQPPKPR
ncbi:hypothetical protein E2C01_099268 [Portunus trituberculatus]|uniref:Uncharacterized protein n=1 Tax=Portunus trituberculatus TaxID=210409 RepID=A0A5B7K9X2_PORTR|nr:hypothetical protein [Portunus trituberculatus]